MDFSGGFGTMGIVIGLIKSFARVLVAMCYAWWLNLVSNCGVWLCVESFCVIQLKLCFDCDDDTE